MDLTAASFDAAGSQQEDLRVIDPSGRELALLLDRPPVPTAREARASAFDARVEGIDDPDYGDDRHREPLTAILLETPSRYFLKGGPTRGIGLRLHVDRPGSGNPGLSRMGAEKLDLPLGGRSAAQVRLTLSDDRAAPVPFSGARLRLEAGPAPAPVFVGATLASRDEFAGETVLTVALDGRHEPLTTLGIETGDPLFMRRVTVGVREVRDGLPDERVVASGPIYRVSVDGAPARSQLEIPLSFIPYTRELLVHIHNGDSPPLGVSAVRLKRYPVSLLFMAPSPGAYALLSATPRPVRPV